MKVIAILSCLLSVASANPIINGVPWEPEPRDQNWINRHNGFVEETRLNNGTTHVLFYGDSITDSWRNTGKAIFDQYYTPLGAANYGISGDRTEHVLWRIINGEVTDALRPDICVTKIGTNNLGSNTDEDISWGIARIVSELHSRAPGMKIFLLGVLPRNNEAMTVRTSNINNNIQRLDNGNTVRFLDMKDHFYNGGNDFNRELYTDDLLHLTLAGYAKWAEVMNPLFFEMVGRK